MPGIFFLYFFCSCTMSQRDCLGLLVIVMETWIYQYCTRWRVDSFKWTNQLWANIDPLFESASSSLQSAVNTLVKCFRKLIFELITKMICPLFDSVLDVTYIGFIIKEWKMVLHSCEFTWEMNFQGRIMPTSISKENVRKLMPDQGLWGLAVTWRSKTRFTSYLQLINRY